MTKKSEDILLALKDESVKQILDTDIISNLATGVSQGFVGEGAASVLGGILGAAAPRINGIWLSYKQNRFERNVKEALEVVINRLDLIERYMKTLDGRQQEKFEGLYIEWLLDNLYEERQVEKVKYHVNGFINMMTNECNDNLMIIFFDTLNQLTQLDIDVLNLYSFDSGESHEELMERYHIEYDQASMIKKKLARLGLLRSKNEKRRDDNLDKVVKYVDALQKDLKSNKPKGVKTPRTEKIWRSETYSITSLGRGYLIVMGINA